MIGLIVSVFTIIIVCTVCILTNTTHEFMAEIRTVFSGSGLCIVCLAAWATAIKTVKKELLK